MQTWMVRAGRGAEHIEDFIDSGVVAIGWEVGKLPSRASKEEILRLLVRQYPNEKPGARGVWASQIVRFLSGIQVGDAVASYRPERRTYVVGEIASDYDWNPGSVPGMPHTRRVEWKHEAPRDRLSVAARNALGSIATLFSISKEVADEMAAVHVPLGSQPPEENEARRSPDPTGDAADLADVTEDVVGRAEAFIEDAISKLDWEEMQDLVAGILRAMGYRTRVAPRGADRGADIMASPDGLGLQEPRIFVEVKHRTGSAMGSKELRAFLGGRRPGDRCLYVSTGGFSKDALYEADRSSVPLTLVTLPDLRRLLVDYYDKLDPDARSLVPLRKLYWPIFDRDL